MKFCLQMFLGAAVAALTFGATNASAELTLVDIDNESNTLTALATSKGSDGNFETAARWASRTKDLVAGTVAGILPDPQTTTDVSFRDGDPTDASDAAIPVARYMEFVYSIDGADFAGDDHRLFHATSGGVSGGINIAADNTIRGTTGDHSFILDMFSDAASKDYQGGGGNWSALRWDMWNSASLTANAGKAITIKAVNFGNVLVPAVVPEPGSIALLGLAGVGMCVRRRKRA